MSPWLREMLGVLVLRGKSVLAVVERIGLTSFHEVFPSGGDAQRAYRDWFDSTRQAVEGTRGSQEVEELVDDQIARRRYRGGWLDMFGRWGGGIRETFSTYWKALPHTVRRELNGVIDRVGLKQVTDTKVVTGAFKLLGGLAKKYQQQLFPEWKYFVDLQTLQDYQKAAPIEEFEESIRDWVTGDITHTINGSQELFDKYFTQGVDQFLRSAPNPYVPAADLQSVDDWLADPMNWARTGTSDGARLEVVNEHGKLVKARKSKWATALAMNRREARKVFWARRKQFNTAIQKRELVKVRAVMGGDFSLYLKMSYFSTWLEAALKGHPNTSLFMGQKAMMALWEQMAADSVAGDRLMMPLDQAEFDHRVSKRMLFQTLACIRRWFLKMFPVDSTLRSSFSEVFDLIEYALDGGVARVGKQTFQVTKGIMSGWRWTALLDSLVNAGELLGFNQYIYDQCGAHPVRNYVVQGDDVRMVVLNPAAAYALWRLYKEGDFLVHPQKFFVKYDADEFLRQVAWLGAVSGYPARAVASILWRNPINSEPLQGLIRAREMLSSWCTLANRGGQKVEESMVKDIAAANGIKLAEVHRLLSTPASLGGLGYRSDYEVEWLAIEEGKAKRTWTFASTPAPAIDLAQAWNVSAEGLADLWAAGVEVAGTNRRVVEKGRLKEVQKVIELVIPVMSGDRGMMMAPRPRQGVPKSVAVLKQRNLARDLDSDASWMDIRSYTTFQTVRSRGSLRVQRAWVLGQLPFATPVVQGWSSAAVSKVHTSAASALWSWLTRRRKIGWGLVLRAAVSAESFVRRGLSDGSLHTMSYKIGG